MERLSERLQDSSLHDTELSSEALSERVNILLQQCEPLSPKQRTKLVLKFGGESVTNPSSKAVLSALSKGSVYEKFLAGQAIWMSGDVETAFHILRLSPSALLKSRVSKLIMRKGSDEEALEALQSLPKANLPGACHYLRNCKRVSVVETFLGTLDAEGELFARLLPNGSHEFVKKYLPGTVNRVRNWTSLVRLHPKVVFDVMCGTISPVISDPKGDLDNRWTSIIKHMNRANPDLANRLVDLAIESISELSTSALSWLSKWRPKEIVKYIIDNDDKVVDLDSVIRELDIEHILELYRNHPKVLSRQAIKDLPSELRRTVWTAFQKEWRDDDGLVSIAVVSVLPADLRAQEARRHLALDYFKIRPDEKMRWIGLLPWDEATVEIGPFIQNSDVNIREAAVQTRIESALYQRDRLGDVIDVVLQRRFEQDYVRQVMLRSLAELPASRWKSCHLSGLAQVVRTTLDAADLSASSITSLRELITQLLPYHTTWAQEQILLLVDERGIGDGISSYEKKYSRYLLPAMWPRMEKIREKGDGDDLPRLLKYFKYRLKDSKDLLPILDELIINHKNPDWTATAIDVVADQLPERLANLVPICLEKDADYFVALNPVRGYMQSHMQYQLMQYVRDQESRCKDDDKSLAVQIIRSKTEYWRWTQSQQQILADILLDYLRNSKRPINILQECIRALSCLNYVDAQHIISFANDERPALRTVTLQCLAHLDGGEGIPILFDALNDDRIRVAIYALRPYILRKPASEALSILCTVPMTKVTAAKEALRLIGDLETEESFQYLLSAYDSDLHVDVRIALLGRLDLYVTRPEVLELLIRALQNEDVAVTKFAAAALNVWDLDRSSVRYYDAVMMILMHNDMRTHSWGPLILQKQGFSDLAQIFAAPLLDMVKNSDPERYPAAQAVFNLYARTASEVVLNVFEGLTGDMKTLGALCEKYSDSVQEGFEQCTRQLVELLRGRRFTLRLRLKLIFKHYAWTEIQAEMDRLVSMGGLHADALVQAQNLTTDLINREEIDGKVVEEAWGNSKYEELRRLGLAALVGRADRTEGWSANVSEWSADMRERLEVYRADKSDLVAEAAAFVFPPKEVEAVLEFGTEDAGW